MIDLALLAGMVTVVALFFAFTNGFQDSSATVATMVASRAATPRGGVLYSSLFGFLGAMLGGSAVAFTMEGLVHIPVDAVFIEVLLAAVVSAAAWNLITWFFGLPSSSTHSLIGGLIGGALVGAGVGSISWGVADLLAGQLTGLTKVFAFLLLSVAIGFTGGYLIKKVSMVLLLNARRKINRPILRVQLITTALLSFAHGANDGQKQMGVITAALLTAGVIGAAEVPLWVRTLCALAIAIGTVGGGWRIMKTLGRRIYPIKPIDALDSQLTSSGSIIFSTAAGAPISSTQTVASSILGVGAAERVKMVQWSVGKHMAVSWLITIPATAALSGLVFIIIDAVLSL